MPSTPNSKGGDKWPKAIEADYERVDPLGAGNFGTVWMVKKKHDAVEGDDDYYAIKGIEIAKKSARAYAEREINILSELRHPNVIQIVRAYDPTPPNSKCRFVVMTLARGPDIGKLVELGGALSVPLARLLARHLISAVSYLHGRAVLHRDIKPDNCILVLDAKNKGRYSTNESYIGDDSLWGSGPGAQNAVDEGRWKIVLADFGFARALAPDEVHSEEPKMRSSIINESKKDLGSVISRASFRLSKIEEMEEVKEAAKRCSAALEELPVLEEDEESETDDSAQPDSAQSPPPAAAKPRRSLAHRGSVARMPVKAMSALGSRFYAAPEVENQFRKKKKTDKNTGHEALTDCVADYGMISDAYSVGVTLREALTGVPPNANVSKYIQENYSPVANLLSSLFCKSSKKRRRKFRYLDEIPKDAALLIGNMTKAKAEDRLTVRQAQMHPWIAGGDGEAEYELPQGDYPSKHGDPVVFMKCATNE